jgi:hypothetical protein
MNTRTRLAAVATGLAVLLLLALAFGWFIDALDGSRSQQIYGLWDEQPGDLQPGIAVNDNARNYGLAHDLPYRFSTNREGFRGGEAKPGGSPVVVVMGDSFVFGMGVNNGETFSDYLQRALEKSFPEVVVHNAGVPGYTALDHLEQWQDSLHTLKPDLVLLCHTASDLKEMARPLSFRRWARHEDDVAGRFDEAIEALILEAEKQSMEAREWWVFTQEALQKRLGARLPTRLIELRRQYAALVLTLASEVADTKAGAQLAMILWVDGYGMANLDAAPIKEQLRAANIPTFDGDRALKSQRKHAQEALFLPDQHFSPLGNETAAGQAAAWILESLLLPTSRRN